MTDYEKIWNFANLYKAHKKARLGKRNTKEVIDFEMNLGIRLTELSNKIRTKTYQTGSYYSFFVYDPKVRKINALHYQDRVVQHCICDEVLSPIFEKHLIYDNAACRKEKGTHFAIRRLTLFFQKYYKKYNSKGYILKCDIKKFFDNINHNILKEKLKRVILDEDVRILLYNIIDSYQTEPGKGLPMGNQTSQWLAIYYLDSFDRLIKEKLKMKYYSRYMDDCIIIHHNKNHLKYVLEVIKEHINKDLQLEFNSKTQISKIDNGVNYLGWHFYLSKSGKVIRKITSQTKNKYKRKLKLMQKLYSKDKMDLKEINQVLASYKAHMSHGHTYRLRKRIISKFVLQKGCQE